MSFRFDTKEEQEEMASGGGRGDVGSGAPGTDTEIALGTRSLVGIFFGLVLICSIFFGLGYSVGRAGGSRAASQPSTDSAPPPAGHGSKPSAEQGLTPAPAPAGDDNGAPVTASSQPAAQPPAKTAAPGPSLSQTPAGPASMPPAKPAVLQPAAATLGTNFMVQVAAVRLPQDADILVGALKKRGYTAVVRNEPQDQLLHIQLGPFNSRGDAVNMRAKLLADGYNAVIK